jgi:hypothetical protein
VILLVAYLPDCLFFPTIFWVSELRVLSQSNIKNQKFISHSSADWESKIRVPYGWVLLWALLWVAETYPYCILEEREEDFLGFPS